MKCVRRSRVSINFKNSKTILLNGNYILVLKIFSLIDTIYLSIYQC